MFGFGFSWIYVSIHDYGAASIPLAGLMTGLFTLFMGCFLALMCYTLVKLFPKNNFQRSVLAFPVIWVLFEILRGWALTGLPWLYIGYSQLNTHLSALAPIGGIWLVSWATVLSASIIYNIFNYALEQKKNPLLRNTLIVIPCLLWGSAAYLNTHKIWTYTKGEPVLVSLLQGNIPQVLRWEPRTLLNIIQKYKELTLIDLQSTPKPSLIVWPESAVPIPLPESQPFINQMDTLLKQQNVSLITGIPVQAPTTNSIAYYNALISIGAGSGVYFKQHLIPFGEYVPFEKWLRGLISFFDLPMSSFISPPDTAHGLLTAGTLRIAPAICYEIAYPNLVRDSLFLSTHPVDKTNNSHTSDITNIADVILTVSNDTWFGNSIGPNQHLEIAQFRALETGRYVLRATNTGLTAIINPQGKIQSIAPQFKDAILKDSISAMQGYTPWVRYGLWPVLLAFAILIALAFIPMVPLKRKK